MKTIKIATDFSDVPLGRYPADSEVSGERFREEFLRPYLVAGPLTVDIDDVEGFGSSFLEEAFGGLVRKGYFKQSDLEKLLTIQTSDPDYEMYKTLIWRYIKEASPQHA